MKINVEKYKQYYFDVAKHILLTPSPSGYYKEVMQVVKNYAIDIFKDDLVLLKSGKINN